MKHIKTLNTKSLQNTLKKGGCGECQTSCQSACKTSCTVGNQTCEHKLAKQYGDRQRRCFAAYPLSPGNTWAKNHCLISEVRVSGFFM